MKKSCHIPFKSSNMIAGTQASQVVNRKCSFTRGHNYEAAKLLVIQLVFDTLFICNHAFN